MPITPTQRLASSAVGLVLISAAFLTGKTLTTHTVTPQLTTGTVKQISFTADAFILRPAGGQLTSYALPGTLPWRNAYGVWQDRGRPACMTPLTHGQRITIAVINAAPVAGAPGGPVIVWLECPGKPIPRYPIVSPPATGRTIRHPCRQERCKSLRPRLTTRPRQRKVTSQPVRGQVPEPPEGSFRYR